MKKMAMACLIIALLAQGTAVFATGSKEGAATASASGPLAIQMTVRLFDQVPDMTNPYWVEYQKRTNTKLDVTFIPDGDYATKLNLILASTDIPEVLIANPSNNWNSPPYLNAVKNGAFWDLTPVLGDFSKYPNLKNNVAPNSWVVGRTLGKIYGIPQSVSTVSSVPKIRKDLLDDLGLPLPQTMEDYAAVLKKVVDKNPDMIGLVSKQDMFINDSGGLAEAFGAGKPTYNAEGGLIYWKLTPQFTDFVNWLRGIYSQGILSKEFSVMKPTQASEFYTSGRAVSFLNESMRWDYAFTQTLKKIKPNADNEPVPPLKGPGGYAIKVGTGIVDQMFIGAKVPRAKMLQIMAYFEKTTTMEYYILTTYGVEGVHYNVVNGYKVVTPQRDKDMGSSAPWQVLPLMYNKYMKTDSTAAPQEYNEAHEKMVDSWGYFDKGFTDPFAVATSETWVAIWPKAVQEWASMAVKAVVGQVSIAEYRSYVDGLNNGADFKKAYQEFAKSYANVYGAR
jgi:putative aldouronate transport system substrate-binding protein